MLNGPTVVLRNELVSWKASVLDPGLPVSEVTPAPRVAPIARFTERGVLPENGQVLLHIAERQFGASESAALVV